MEKRKGDTALRVPSFTLFCCMFWGKFPRLVGMGKYFIYLLPMQILATHKEKHNKIGRIRGCATLKMRDG